MMAPEEHGVTLPRAGEFGVDDDFLEASRAGRLSYKMRESREALDQTLEELERRTELVNAFADDVSNSRVVLSP